MLELFNIPYLLTTYGYLGVGIIVFLESGIFFPLPGDSLLFTAGVLASTGYLKIYLLVPLIFVSTFLGGIAGYYMGIHIEKLRKYSFFAKILRADHVDKAHQFFVKHGKIAVIFCRFVPIVRTFTPIVAGVVKMEYKTFLKYSFYGSVLWSTVVTFSGYFLGQIFPQIKDYMPVIIFAVVLASFLPVIVEIFKKKKE
ncbi:MAG: DedA family protein [Candidatus Nomurabacteria bacterium]|nr:DedA family protein [Candidatus Nomurabacteria bacterium]